eukprot:TRINITY_DN5524_c0_g1_i1.p1 TRINITY_DN5524_c0_g1~~TRINITY_DN5524_c0_g1_i1.p1  ORF type:complete len:291 (-),score=45.51 TRINITY_DN5524_c0_g1_i1:30-902(-)
MARAYRDVINISQLREHHTTEALILEHTKQTSALRERLTQTEARLATALTCLAERDSKLTSLRLGSKTPPPSPPSVRSPSAPSSKPPRKFTHAHTSSDTGKDYVTPTQVEQELRRLRAENERLLQEVATLRRKHDKRVDPLGCRTPTERRHEDEDTCPTSCCDGLPEAAVARFLHEMDKLQGEISIIRADNDELQAKNRLLTRKLRAEEDKCAASGPSVEDRLSREIARLSKQLALATTKEHEQEDTICGLRGQLANKTLELERLHKHTTASAKGRLMSPPVTPSKPPQL